MKGGGAGRGPREKTQVSDEHLAGVILDYLVRRHEQRSPGLSSGCTAYHITHKAPIKTSQRQQRVEVILELLEKQKYVRADRFETATMYEITPEGLTWYKNVAKSFLAVFYGGTSDQQ